MNENAHFDMKWVEAKANKKGQEFMLYVEDGKCPATQRQFNLFHYMDFIDRRIAGKGYTTSLELGAGRGTISLYLKKRHRFSVTLNDLSESGMELARANFMHVGEEASFDVADATHLPYADNSFDVVTSIGLMEHLDEYTPILREAYRVLKPDGMMIQINIPKKRSIQMLNSVYRAILKLCGVELRADFPRNADRPEDYARHAREVGFIDVETINVNPFPLFVPMSLFMDRKLTMLYRVIMRMRSWFMEYPFKTNYAFSQCHFLVGHKK